MNTLPNENNNEICMLNESTMRYTLFRWRETRETLKMFEFHDVKIKRKVTNPKENKLKKKKYQAGQKPTPPHLPNLFLVISSSSEARSC